MTRHEGHAIVPCGKCTECRRRRLNDWVLRLSAEERNYFGASFITLTYAPEHVPITPKGYMTVQKRDVQLFMKRLRYLSPGAKIKYYCAAEYGSKQKSYRPHYHLILFGADPEKVDLAWGLGDIHVGDASGASIAYTLKYISKEKLIPQHQNDDRVPEFSLSSTNLGKSYMSPAVVKWHVNNSASYYLKDGGFRAALPRYYRDRIFTQEQKDTINYVQQIKARAAYERAVNDAGGVIEYYRQQGQIARADKLKQKQKNNENQNNGKL